MIAPQISPKIESLYGMGRQASKFYDFVWNCVQRSHQNNFPLKTLRLGRVTLHFGKIAFKETRPRPLTFLQYGLGQGCLPFGQKIRKFRFEVKW